MRDRVRMAVNTHVDDIVCDFYLLSVLSTEQAMGIWVIGPWVKWVTILNGSRGLWISACCDKIKFLLKFLLHVEP